MTETTDTQDALPLLSAAALSAAYDRTTVLHSVSAAFNKGEFVCLIGPNGSGKSTFLSLLSGLSVPSLKRTGGACCLEGKDVESYSPKERARIITFLPQNETYTWNYSVLEAVRMGRYTQSNGIIGYSEEDDEAARNALLQAGIENLEKRFIFELSGGEMQSVLIARSLAQSTQALLLDEPFTYLDAGKSDRLFRLLKKVTQAESKCLIMSMHDINLAPLYADRIILFSEGRILADGKSTEVFTDENLEKAYGTPFIQYEHPVYGIPQVCTRL